MFSRFILFSLTITSILLGRRFLDGQGIMWKLVPKKYSQKNYFELIYEAMYKLDHFFLVHIDISKVIN